MRSTLFAIAALLAGLTAAAAQPVIVEPDDRGAAARPVAAAQVVTFTRALTVEDRRIDVPFTLFLAAEDSRTALVTLSADLQPVQRLLPALLSRTDDEDCDDTTRVEVTDVTARGRDVTLSGRVELRRYLCLGDRRLSEVLRQGADISVTLGGRVSDGCLRLRATTVALDPDGAAGALFDAVGATDRITRRLRKRIDRSLSRGACIELPPELAALDTQITGGSLRELGTGGLGAVLNARLTVDVHNFIRLIGLLADDGKLGD